MESLNLDPEMNFPKDFRCPISMEIMDEPVIISTGVSYERGLEILLQIIAQILEDGSDFVAFRACEEALGVLQHLLISQEDGKIIEMLSNPKYMKSMAIVLERGSREARLHTISIFQEIAKSDFTWNLIVNDLGVSMFKSLLEFLSDEICTKESSFILQVWIKILDSSKRSRLKAIEAGAICTLIELLPDSNRSKCEKILQIIKLLCECADGRVAFMEHRLGIGAISKKLLNVSEIASKICVKIFWLISNFHPADVVLDEMMIYGAVKKFVALLHMSGPSSTKDKVAHMFKKHGNSWRRDPCFPCELNDYSSTLQVHHGHIMDN
ncbi:Armadillo-like helical [Cynara cardunculus var. scolymus]|uniref:U-box domain-containing protein n=1 Tax=Cynara cardunculus var. scolymus TaxID=59895 RepID=A0A124SEM3_CYNCS|nr:Armadillo-like helical [Cynara cardunculus var. scolymus]